MFAFLTNIRMATQFRNLLSAEDIDSILALPEVQAAKSSLREKARGTAYLTAPVPAHVSAALRDQMDVSLAGDSVPMRWIKGDTEAHADSGAGAFARTQLVYLHDSPGSLIVDGTAYPIERGTGYSFNEGLRHATEGAGDEPRLLLGPMSERGFVVGFIPPTTTTCCPKPEDLKGLPYDTRAEIKIGTIVKLGPSQKPYTSYTDRINVIKSIAARRS